MLSVDLSRRYAGLFEKAVNHSRALPISRAPCRAGEELRVIIEFTEKLRDDEDVKGFPLGTHVKFIQCRLRQGELNLTCELLLCVKAPTE